MQLTNERIQEILLKSGFVNQDDLKSAVQAAADMEKSLLDILLFRGLINDNLFGQLMADELKVPYINLDHYSIPLEVLNQVPEKMARSKKVIPFAVDKDGLSLAMQDPHDVEIIELIHRKSGLDIKPHFITPYTLQKALSQYKKDIKDKFNDIIQENLKKTGRPSDDADLNRIAVEVPLIKIIDTILEYAIAERASDIHIEKTEKNVIIRLRVDGVLRDILELPPEMSQSLIARIKILSNLKIDEHRVPQDGRFKHTIGEERISLRVSIVPAFYGENAVMRLLFESARPLSLEELGINGCNLDVIKNAMRQPHGMLLVTGPTGSGKTTTLYSVLNMLNSLASKICTIEDPVEYDINRLTQIQTNSITGLTFAAGLRALLRHDPDIIMVGEIRDRETAEIAIHSALTGHLVLSTLHTNDAASSIPRLLDMGVEPFLVTATLNIIIAQRLVRRLCSNCIHEIKPEKLKMDRLVQIFGASVLKQKFYAGRGCPECGQSGFKGRIGIYEILQATEKIRQAVLAKESPDVIQKLAIKEGMITMLLDGLNKVAAGMTSIEEVLRVVEES